MDYIIPDMIDDVLVSVWAGLNKVQSCVVNRTKLANLDELEAKYGCLATRGSSQISLEDGGLVLTVFIGGEEVKIVIKASIMSRNKLKPTRKE
jgi:hypothetical protein